MRALAFHLELARRRPPPTHLPRPTPPAHHPPHPAPPAHRQPSDTLRPLLRRRRPQVGGSARAALRLVRARRQGAPRRAADAARAARDRKVCPLRQRRAAARPRLELAHHPARPGRPLHAGGAALRPRAAPPPLWPRREPRRLSLVHSAHPLTPSLTRLSPPSRSLLLLLPGAALAVDMRDVQQRLYSLLAEQAQPSPPCLDPMPRRPDNTRTTRPKHLAPWRMPRPPLGFRARRVRAPGPPTRLLRCRRLCSPTRASSPPHSTASTTSAASARRCSRRASPPSFAGASTLDAAVHILALEKTRPPAAFRHTQAASFALVALAFLQGASVHCTTPSSHPQPPARALQARRRRRHPASRARRRPPRRRLAAARRVPSRHGAARRDRPRRPAARAGACRRA